MKKPETGWRPEHSQLYAQHGNHIRGHVRYEVARHNILGVLGEFLNEPRRIADVGGGNGLDAKWIAVQGAGHSVYLFEPDQASATEAVSDNNGLISVIRGDAQTALDYYGPESFDMLLSHGVLMYMNNPADELKRLTDLTRPGGYLSIMNAGQFGKLNKYAKRGNQQMVDQLRLTGKYTNDIGAQARAFLPGELEQLIAGAGLEIVDWFGVRILSDSDTRKTDEVPAFHRNRIVDAEIRASSDPRTRPSGQMLQFIAKKPN